MIATWISLLVVMSFSFSFQLQGIQALFEAQLFMEFYTEKQAQKHCFHQACFLNSRSEPRSMNKWCLHLKQISCINNL